MAILGSTNDRIPAAYIQSGTFIARLVEKLLLVRDHRDRSGETMEGNCLGAMFMSFQADNRWEQLHAHVHLAILALLRSAQGHYRAAEVSLIYEELGDLRACFLGALAYYVDSEEGYELEYLDRDFRVPGVPEDLVRAHTSPLVKDPDAGRPAKRPLTRQWLDGLLNEVDRTYGSSMRAVDAKAEQRRNSPRPTIPTEWLEREVARAIEEKPITTITALVARVLWTWPGQVDPDRVLGICESKTVPITAQLPSLRGSAATVTGIAKLGELVKRATQIHSEKNFAQGLERAPLLLGLLGAHLRESSTCIHLVQVTENQAYRLRQRAREAEEIQGLHSTYQGVYQPAAGVTLIDVDASMPAEAAARASEAIAHGDQVLLFGQGPATGLPRQTTPLGAIEAKAEMARTLLSRPPTQPAMFPAPRKVYGDIRHSPKRPAAEVEPEIEGDVDDPGRDAAVGTKPGGGPATHPKPEPDLDVAAARPDPTIPDETGVAEPVPQPGDAGGSVPQPPEVGPTPRPRPGSSGPMSVGSDADPTPGVEPPSTPRADPDTAVPPTCGGVGSGTFAKSLATLDDEFPVSPEDMVRRVVPPLGGPKPKEPLETPWSITPDQLRDLVAERTQLPVALVSPRRDGVVVRRSIGNLQPEAFIAWAQVHGQAVECLPVKSTVSPKRRLGVVSSSSELSTVEHWIDARSCRTAEDLEAVLHDASGIQSMVDSFIDSGIYPPGIRPSDFVPDARLLRTLFREAGERQVALTCTSPSEATLSVSLGRSEEPVTVAALDCAIQRWGPGIDGVDLDDLERLRVRKREDGRLCVEVDLPISDECRDRAPSLCDLLATVCSAAPQLLGAAAWEVARRAREFEARALPLVRSHLGHAHRPDEGGVRLRVLLEDAPGLETSDLLQACVGVMTAKGLANARILGAKTPLEMGEVGVGRLADGRLAMEAWFTDEWIESTPTEEHTTALAELLGLSVELRSMIRIPSAGKADPDGMPM